MATSVFSFVRLRSAVIATRSSHSSTVVQIAGTTATVEGGPSCLSPSSYCGSTIPTVTAYFTGLPMVPTYGDVIDLYGTTGTNTLSAAGYVVKGHCDPDFGC